ncbi:MAG TPA: DUF2378 family protein, partial [Archangium sp.]|nr:DUF2378 family protein [Archangium sp.]
LPPGSSWTGVVETEALHCATQGRHAQMNGGSQQTSTREESGLGSEQELLRRLSLATPADTVRGFAINNMLGVVREELGAEAMARCLEHCEEKEFTAFFNYPISHHLRVMYAAAWMLSERHDGFDNAIRRLSRGFTPGFLSSTVGRAFMVLSQQGARPLFNNIPMAHRAVASFGEIHVTWTGMRSGLLTSKRDFLLYMNHESALLGLMQVLRLSSPRVRGWQTGPLENEVEFSWE